MNKVKLYIDIDGVLLTKRNPQLAKDAKPFIKIITKYYDCYWLTTHCRGDTKGLIDNLSVYFGKEFNKHLKKIKPTKWDTLKTEAISINKDFYWLDDLPLQAEVDFLTKNGLLDRLIIVNLARENELMNIAGRLLKGSLLLKSNFSSPAILG